MEFKPYPKTPRLRRTVVITEKIDGTNAQIQFDADGNMLVGSRKREIFPEATVVDPCTGKYVKGTDNFAFAHWAYSHRTELFEFLGEGCHYGEWAGEGIQRGYGLSKKMFFLFNTARFGPQGQEIPASLFQAGLTVVPVLYEGPNEDTAITACMSALRSRGSCLNKAEPEGIIVYHTASRSVAKVTFDHDEGKWNE